MDPLRMGMGWKEEDLTKPQILIESTYGQSHPARAHLLNLAQKKQAEAHTKRAARVRFTLRPIFATAWHRGTMASIIPLP